jgi:hypothetical protein
MSVKHLAAPLLTLAERATRLLHQSLQLHFHRYDLGFEDGYNQMER